MYTRHYSKVDAWLGIAIWGSALLAFIIVLAVGAKDFPNPAARLGIALVPFAITVASIYPLYYELQADELIVRCGFLRYRVPYGAIISAEPSRSTLSAPAMSLDRLQIRYTAPNGSARSLLISPVDKAAFMADLCAHAPALRFDGERVRAG